ncbi:MAG: signal peptide peptidase SppA [Ignavibacteriales bacterium]|nr:signal peptide peptidase SppA [Ignavibacteriales bacterium]
MSKSTKWFLIITGILVVFGFGSVLFFYVIMNSLTDFESDVVIGSGDKIAVVELKGVILSSEETVRQLKKYRQDKSIRGILFRVDSPGGGVVASQEIFEEVKKVRDHGKPIVVSMGSLAASGGYYVSCPASKIVANPGTLTGSIGVISQFMRYDSLLGKIGVQVNTIKSGKLKDAGSPFRAMTGADREYFQQLMDDVHQQFIFAVEKERKLSHDSVLAFADGRVFTGEQAFGLGLVDTIGTYEDAIKITARLAGIKGDPSIVKERKRRLSLIDLAFGESKIDEFFGLKEKLLDQPILQYRMVHTF